MKLKKQHYWIIAIILVAIIYFGFNNVNNVKRAVADVEGQPCTKDSQCPCMGKYNVTGGIPTEAFGVGTGSCESNKCDMSYCVDLKPITTWTKENVWMFLKNNSLIFFALIALVVLLILWPKS